MIEQDTYITAGSKINITNNVSASQTIIEHDTSGVTPSTYPCANITVDSTGHITSASSGLIGNNPIQLLRYIFNNSGSQLPAGGVAVCDSSIDNAFKQTTLQGDPSVTGIAVSAINAGSYGYLARDGYYPVLVTGAVTRGHRLIASTTHGYAKDAGTTQRGTTGDLGIAQTGYSGSSLSTVYADLDIHPYTSNTTLQKLPTSTPYNNPNSFSTHTFAHTVDSGTDLLVLRVSHYGTPATAVTYNGYALTALVNAYDSYNNDSEIYYLVNPPIGTYNVVITQTAGYCCCLANNFLGSKISAPFRTPVSNVLGTGTTTAALASVSVLGDINIDLLTADNSAVWTPTGTSQVTDYSVLNGSGHSINCSTKPSTVGSTTMSWSCSTTSRVVYIVVALAGS